MTKKHPIQLALEKVGVECFHCAGSLAFAHKNIFLLGYELAIVDSELDLGMLKTLDIHEKFGSSRIYFFPYIPLAYNEKEVIAD